MVHFSRAKNLVVSSEGACGFVASSGGSVGSNGKLEKEEEDVKTHC